MRYIGSSGSIVGCEIAGNTAMYGGGFCFNNSSPSISSTHIYDNNALQGGGGYTEGGEVDIKSCEFSNNIAKDSSAALRILSCSVYVESSSFYENMGTLMYSTFLIYRY